MTLTHAACLPLLAALGAPPAAAPDTAACVPVPGRCLEFIYGEDPETWAGGAKPDDHWVTLQFDFGDTSDYEFGWMTPDGFVSAADPGSTSCRTGVPPGSVMSWAVRLPESGEILTLARAGAIALDPSSGVAARWSVEPRVERAYFGRATLHFDLDGDGIPDRAVALAVESPRGFLPRDCPPD